MKLPFLLFITIWGFSFCNQHSKSPQHILQDTLAAPIQDVRQTRVLFVQWQYPDSMEFMKALSTRQKTEIILDDSLGQSGHGQWIGGDLGPGGANMLFEVNDAEKAMSLISNILKGLSMEKETVIAIDNGNIQRGESPSNYKVIHPKNYTGKFIDW